MLPRSAVDGFARRFSVAPGRRLALVLTITSALALVSAGACGDSFSTVDPPAGGSGGTAGSAGSGAAGSGAGGSGGDAGDAGQDSGGSAGDAGAGGEAGSSGSAGAGGDSGSAGSAGSGDAGSGDAGSAGFGGSAGLGGSGGGGGAGCVAAERRLTEAAGASARPALVRTSDGFAVTWTDSRDGNPEIYFQRLDDAGNASGVAVRVTTDAANSGVSSLAFTGSDFGLAWGDDRAGNPEIFFQRLTLDGTPLGLPLRVSEASGVSAEPKMVWAGTRFGLVWNDNRAGQFDIYFVEIDANGSEIGAEVPITDDPKDSFRPALVWNETDYAASWNDDRDGNFEIYVKGTLTSNSMAERVTSDAGLSLFSALVWNGSGFGVAWQDNRDGNDEVYFARLEPDGRKLGEDLRVTKDAAASGGAALAWDGKEYVLAWDDGRTGDGDIYYARLDAAGAKTTSDLPLSPASGSSIFASLAVAERGFGVAWADQRYAGTMGDNSEIYFMRVCP